MQLAPGDQSSRSRAREYYQIAQQSVKGQAMFLRNMIFYSVVGGVLWAVAGRLGVGLGVNLAISLLVPPLLIIAYTLYKHRGPLL